jgi:hypothetical protein
MRGAPAILLLFLLGAGALTGCDRPVIVCGYLDSWCRGHFYRVETGWRVITRHEGIDFAGGVGAPVISASHGQVVMANPIEHCGGTVAVRTDITDPEFGPGHPLYVRYHHILPDPGVRYGMEIAPGQKIGTMQDPATIPGAASASASHISTSSCRPMPTRTSITAIRMRSG